MKKQQVCGRWYERKVEPVIENDICDIVKMLWDVCIQVDRKIEHRKPHIVVMEKTTSKSLITDVACPVSNNLILKRNEKPDNYSEIQLECDVLVVIFHLVFFFSAHFLTLLFFTFFYFICSFSNSIFTITFMCQ